MHMQNIVFLILKMIANIIYLSHGFMVAADLLTLYSYAFLNEVLLLAIVCCTYNTVLIWSVPKDTKSYKKEDDELAKLLSTKL